MQEINRRPPDSMTVSERMDEVTALLARGVSRVWDQSVAKSANMVSKSHLGLGFNSYQSVHTDTLTKVTESK